MTTITHKPGEFCWINILSPDPDKARDFFATLLGWEFTEMRGMGHGIKVGGRNIGGLFNTVSERTPNGMQAVLGVMIKVERADATVEQIRSLGGKADPAFDIGPAGRMAVCHDPNGAKFDLWEPKAMHGTDVDSTLHGAPSWCETITSDTERAGQFYTTLFGWTPTVSTASGALCLGWAFSENFGSLAKRNGRAALRAHVTAGARALVVFFGQRGVFAWLAAPFLLERGSAFLLH